MKGMWNSSEAFTAHATVDAGMWMLHNIANANGAKWDWDSGEGTQIRFTAKDAPDVISILTDMIEAKQVTGEDSEWERAHKQVAEELLQNPDGETAKMWYDVMAKRSQ